MIRLILPFLILPSVICNALQLNLLSSPNASSIARSKTSTLNTTGITTHNDCYEHSQGHLFVTTKSDCERALDKLVNGKSLTELHHFGYQGYHGHRITDQLPVEAEYGSCNIAFLTFDLDTRITLTYAEIYAELLGPDGVLKECLGPAVPYAEALGGQTAMGPLNMLVAEVTGLPRKVADQESR